MTFQSDYAGATVYPAHPDNYGGYGSANDPRAIVIHTPEEPADGYDSTPVWFANPAAQASTHYYVNIHGKVVQMVPEIECPWANGNRGGVNRTWKGKKDAWPPWATQGLSLNCQTISIECEGYAASIGQTWTDAQHNALVRLIKDIDNRYGIPSDRDHIIAHFEVATDRTDPGSTFPWDRLMADLNEKPSGEIDITKVRIVPVGEPDVRWTDKPDEREIVNRVRLVVDP